MKFIGIAIFTIVSFISESKAMYTEDEFMFDKTSKAIKDSIIGVDFATYVGKPIDSLMAVLPKRYERKYVSSGSSAIVGEYLFVVYSPTLLVIIRKSTKNFMPVIDDNRKWNVSLFQKENFRCAIAYDTNECINGCECTDVIR